MLTLLLVFSSSQQLGAEAQFSEAESAVTDKQQTIHFVLDTSLTMKEKFGDESQKMDFAKKILQQALARLYPDVTLGFRVFGYTNQPNIEPCNATTLLVPLGTRNRRDIVRAIREVRPGGKRPLTSAIAQSVERDLARATGKVTILLITDGTDSCGFDPCRFVQKLPNLPKIDIIGLGVKRATSSHKQLECIAESSGGEFYDLQSPADLGVQEPKILENNSTSRNLSKPFSSLPRTP